MSVAGNQQRTFLKLINELRPHWRRDPALPARIQSLLTRQRQFGSRDRRLYRELIYTTVRFLPWVEPVVDSDPSEAVRRVAWLAADIPATHSFRSELATGEPPVGDKAALLPPWFREHCPDIFSGAELEAQLQRAPVWLRWQTRKRADVANEFANRGLDWRQSEVLASAFEVLTEADATATDAWRNGLIEVQDLGSQLLLEAIGISAGERWLDACAGAGGKTLQLAALLAGGHIDAHDVRATALAELRLRARRAPHLCQLTGDDAHDGAVQGDEPLAGATRRTTVRVLGSGAVKGEYDGVLVDAPCSGSGTWRRAPHLKWVTTEAAARQAAEIQRQLLHRFSGNVRPGGRLVYATCSLSARENEDVAAAFLASHPNFEAAPFARTFNAAIRGPGLLILPAVHNSDGFYVSSFRRSGA